MSTLETALTRWAVKCKSWSELGGTHPYIGAFLAGWYMREIGGHLLTFPEDANIRYRDSYNAGYAECEYFIKGVGETK